MEREYITITTPVDKKAVKLKAWLTGRERRAIQSAFAEGVDFSEDKPKYNPTQMSRAQDVAIENIAVSIDDNQENLLNKILDLRDTDFNFVKYTIDEITSGKGTGELKKN